MSWQRGKLLNQLSESVTLINYSAVWLIGIWPESKSFGDEGLGPVPARWKGVCQGGDSFNSSSCNRSVASSSLPHNPYILCAHDILACFRSHAHGSIEFFFDKKNRNNILKILKNLKKHLDVNYVIIYHLVKYQLKIPNIRAYTKITKSDFPK
jgi:hypothetical protein